MRTPPTSRLGVLLASLLVTSACGGPARDAGDPVAPPPEPAGGAEQSGATWAPATIATSSSAGPAKLVVSSGPCAGMTYPGDDADTEKLRVASPPRVHRRHDHDHDHDRHRGGRHREEPRDPPPPLPELVVDAHGLITTAGKVQEPATMADVSDAQVVTTAFTFERADRHCRDDSWEAALRPPRLGTNLLCVRAVLHDEHGRHHDGHGRDHDGHGRDHDGHGRDHDGHGGHHPPVYVRVLRPFTAVDRVPPSAVPGLQLASVTARGATAIWGAASDNYGLAGYDVMVDGGPAHRTTVGTRRFVITGLSPSTTHTVSVVAVDLAGNTSAAATASFTTAALPPPPTPPPSGPDLTITPEEGSAVAVWHPADQEASYRTYLDGEVYAEFPLAQYCEDAAGRPASPCTTRDVIRFPVTPLDQDTGYTLRVDALRADGSAGRAFSATFFTTTGPDTVSDASRERLASEASQCAGRGGTFYASPRARQAVAVPAGAVELFAGCYRVADSSCIDAFLPPTRSKLLDCADDLTRLVLSLAPAGRGPVISSLDGVFGGVIAPPLPGPRVPIEPITWCAGGACTVVLETAEEAAVVAAEAAGATAAASVVAFAAGVAVALAVDELLQIVFAEELGVAGLYEYPIHHDTDFETFDNWGVNRGVYYNSLKIYAEAIKTTTLYARQSNLPFAWDDTEDQKFKQSVDRGCSAQRGHASVSTPYGCGDDGYAVYVPGGRNYRLQSMPQTGQHIVSAMSDSALTASPARVQWFSPSYSRGGNAARAKGYGRSWFDRAQFQTNACTGRLPGSVCDEFPFWSTSQAVDLSGIVASLAPVPFLEASPQGNDLSQFYRQCKVRDGDAFMVLPIEPWVKAGGPSFGFRVTKGGTSLCLVPKP